MIGYAVCLRDAGLGDIVELRVQEPGRARAAALLRHLRQAEQAEAADFWMLDGFLQKDRLPRFLLDRGTAGVMFVSGTEAVDLPRDPNRWACSYLDSDW